VGRSGRFVLKRATWSMDGPTVLVRFRRGFSTFVLQITPKRFGQQLYDVSPENARGQEGVTLTGGYLKGQRDATAIMPGFGDWRAKRAGAGGPSGLPPRPSRRSGLRVKISPRRPPCR